MSTPQVPDELRERAVRTPIASAYSSTPSSALGS
jgi:hypothetical protein